MQDIRKFDTASSTESVKTENVIPEVQQLLNACKEEMKTRKLKCADDDIEVICIVLHPRYRLCTTGVSRNGGDTLRSKMDKVLKMMLTKFMGTIDGDGAEFEKQPEGVLFTANSSCILALPKVMTLSRLYFATTTAHQAEAHANHERR